MPSFIEKFDVLRGSVLNQPPAIALWQSLFLRPPVVSRLARFARSPWLACQAHTFGVRAVWQRFASHTALSASLLAPSMLALARCSLRGLARFARSHSLATLAPSRGCRLVFAPWVFAHATAPNAFSYYCPGTLITL